MKQKKLEFENIFSNFCSENVDMEKLKKYAINLEKYGTKYSLTIAKDNITTAEKLLITQLAVQQAIKLEHYSKRNELSGMLLYGLMLLEYFDIAELLIKHTMEPINGGSLSLGNYYLLNLRWIKKYALEKKDPNSNLEKASEKLEALVKEYLDKYFEQLFNTENFLINREIIQARFNVLKKILKFIGIIGVLFGAAWLGKFLGILTLIFLK